jgi:hypothetical protein
VDPLPFRYVLANNLKPASIKVYLSAVRALHIEHGYPDPLVGCLRLWQRASNVAKAALKISAFQLHRTFLARSIAAWTSWFTMTFCSGPLVVWYILVSCDHPSLLYLMALPILHRFTYRIKMLPLTEESIRLVFKCLSKYLKPIPFGKGALWVVLPCVRSNRYSATWRSEEVQTALCSSVPMAPPPDTYSFYRASAPTAEPGWYNWSFWQS